MEAQAVDVRSDFFRLYPELATSVNGLVPELRKKVGEAVGYLLKIRQVGENVLEADATNLPEKLGVDTLPAEFLEEIDRYNKFYLQDGNNGWLYMSVQDMIDLAKKTDYDTRHARKELAFKNVDAFRRELVKSGDFYEQFARQQGQLTDSSELPEYVHGSRYRQIEEISNIENQDLVPLLGDIRP